MRIIAVSDLHLDHVTRGVARYEELRKLLFESVLGAVVEREADAFFFLGDLCDPDLHAPATIRAIECALAVADRLHGLGVPSVWLAGNHDTVEDGSDTTTLSPLRRAPGAIVVEEPARFEIRERIDVVAFPFTSFSRPYDPEEWAKAQCRPGSRPLITLSHLAVPGIQPGEETVDMPRGREVIFPFKHTASATMRMSGHYHRAQSFDPGDGGPPIEVVGSLARLTFSEEGNTPGILYAEVG